MSGPIWLSPDGLWIALVIRGRATCEDSGDKREEGKPLEVMPEELVGSEVVLVHTQMGEVQQPFESFQASIAPVWSPDGEFLALLCQDGVGRFPRVTLWNRREEARVCEAALTSPSTGFFVLRNYYEKFSYPPLVSPVSGDFFPELRGARQNRC